MPDEIMPPKKFKTGAKSTPRHKLAAATPFKPLPSLMGVPDKFGIVPTQLSMWGNDQYGDCVTAEEAYAKAAYSILCGLPELFITEQSVIAWADKYGFLNGAALTDVMDEMKYNGLPDASGKTYEDGPYTAVDWTNDANLQAAITQGPIKIGVASAQLQNVPGIGTTNGWFATGFTQASPQDEDHCICYTGYGTIADCYKFLNMPVLSSVPDPTKPGILAFTWSTVGVIDKESMLAVTFEAWSRNPTTVGVFPPTPTPVPPAPPTPTPTPTPPVPTTGFTGSLSYLNGSLVNVASASNKYALGSINWLNVLQLVIQYGSVALPIILSDLKAGKSWSEILADLEAAFGF
jgi:hypothetical protein